MNGAQRREEIARIKLLLAPKGPCGVPPSQDEMNHALRRLAEVQAAQEQAFERVEYALRTLGINL